MELIASILESTSGQDNIPPPLDSFETTDNVVSEPTSQDTVVTEYLDHGSSSESPDQRTSVPEKAVTADASLMEAPQDIQIQSMQETIEDVHGALTGEVPAVMDVEKTQDIEEPQGVVDKLQDQRNLMQPRLMVCRLHCTQIL